MLTRPKRDTTKLRVVLDLSFPDGLSVNSEIPRTHLDGAAFKLRLPTVHDLAAIVATLGQGCHLYKIDLSRAYRQLRSDPLDWALLGLHWNGNNFIDIAIPFGLRHGASACQRVTEAIINITNYDLPIEAFAYIDDTCGAALPTVSSSHYRALLGNMDRLGLDSAPSKCQPPTTCLTWIGVTVDTIAMTMAIDKDRIKEAVAACNAFQTAQFVTRKFMERLLGKIFHAIKCTDGARRFTARLLALLNRTSEGTRTPIDSEARADATWLLAFLPRFNGTTIIKPTTAQVMVEVDACLQGAGGLYIGQEYYHFRFPSSILQCGLSISSLECLNLLVATRIWIAQWAGKVVLVFCDNAAAICAINSGRAQDPILQGAIRELWLLCATFDVTLTARHKPGELMVKADALSRLYLPHKNTQTFRDIVKNLSESQRFVRWQHVLPPCPI